MVEERLGRAWANDDEEDDKLDEGLNFERSWLGPGDARDLPLYDWSVYPRDLGLSG